MRQLQSNGAVRATRSGVHGLNEWEIVAVAAEDLAADVRQLAAHGGVVL